jgi:hypothetical protein
MYGAKPQEDPPPPLQNKEQDIDRLQMALFLCVAQGGRARHAFSLAWLEAALLYIPVEVDTGRLETSRTEEGVLKKLSLAGIAKLSQLKYS